MKTIQTIILDKIQSTVEKHGFLPALSLNMENTRGGTIYLMTRQLETKAKMTFTFKTDMAHFDFYHAKILVNSYDIDFDGTAENFLLQLSQFLQDIPKNFADDLVEPYLSETVYR